MSEATHWFVGTGPADEHDSLGRRIIDGANARLAQVLDAQTRNSLLSGETLRGAARDLIAASDGLQLMAADEPGERIIGAALAMSDRLSVLDKSQRHDGKNVLLVSGYTAGDIGRARAVRIARCLGAARIELAVLSPCEPVDDCDKITLIGTGDPVRLDLEAEFQAIGWQLRPRGPFGSYVRYAAPSWYPWTVESVIIPFDEDAPDFTQIRGEAIQVLHVARATYMARAQATTLSRPGRRDGRP